MSLMACQDNHQDLLKSKGHSGLKQIAEKSVKLSTSALIKTDVRSRGMNKLMRISINLAWLNP